MCWYLCTTFLSPEYFHNYNQISSSVQYWPYHSYSPPQLQDFPPIVNLVGVCACLINNIRLVSYLSSIGHTQFWGCKGIELEMSCITLWRLMYSAESLTTGVPTGRQYGKSRIFCYLWPWHYVLVSHTTIQSSHSTPREVTFKDDVHGISER